MMTVVCALILSVPTAACVAGAVDMSCEHEMDRRCCGGEQALRHYSFLKYVPTVCHSRRAPEKKFSVPSKRLAALRRVNVKFRLGPESVQHCIPRRITKDAAVLKSTADCKYVTNADICTF